MDKQSKTETLNADVAVVGGGPAGLVAASMLARSGISVVCFAPKPRHKDLRTSALMQGSVSILKTVDVWDQLEPLSAPLRVMRLIDDTGRLLRAPTVEFNADEIGDEPYGHNFKNSDLVSTLRNKAKSTSHITLLDRTVQSIEIGTDIVSLRDLMNQDWVVELVVAADGRQSMCRKSAGIAFTEKRLPQVALVFNIAHSRAHNDISTEFHRADGPLTFVPLPGNNSSVVWVENPKIAARLLALEQSEFLEEIQERSYGFLGDISTISAISSFPLTQLEVETLAKNRTLLVGEAGHVVPPIGAQGLNLGFRDAATIANLFLKARSNGLSLSESDILESYDKQRKTDISSRSQMVNLLNQSVLSDFIPVQVARSAGLFALANINPLRRLAMKTGIGPNPENKSKAG